VKLIPLRLHGVVHGHRKQNMLYPTITISVSHVKQLKTVKVKVKAVARLHSLRTMYGGVEV
jgi:hypothetical protein